VAEQLQASLAALRLLKSVGVFPPPQLASQGAAGETSTGETSTPATAPSPAPR
jgi:hypothetical protein